MHNSILWYSSKYTSTCFHLKQSTKERGFILYLDLLSSILVLSRTLRGWGWLGCAEKQKTTKLDIQFSFSSMCQKSVFTGLFSTISTLPNNDTLLLRSPPGSFHIWVSRVCSAGWQKSPRLRGRPMGVLFTPCENTRSPHLEPCGTSQPGDLPRSVCSRVDAHSVYRLQRSESRPNGLKEREACCHPVFLCIEPQERSFRLVASIMIIGNVFTTGVRFTPSRSFLIYKSIIFRFTSHFCKYCPLHFLSMLILFLLGFRENTALVTQTNL